MDEGTQWNDASDVTMTVSVNHHVIPPHENDVKDRATSSTTKSVRFEDPDDAAVDAGSMLSKLGLQPADVIPYPSLAITRNTSQKLSQTRKLLLRAYDNAASTEQYGGGSHLLQEQVVPLQNGDNHRVLAHNYGPTYKLPAWPSYLSGDTVKFCKKAQLSPKRYKRVALSENAEPKANKGFWQHKQINQSNRTPVQDRLPPRSKSHMGFPRSSTAFSRRRELPTRPHTSDMTGYTSKLPFRNIPSGGADPDLINPRVLMDVLESENITVNHKDIHSPTVAHRLPPRDVTSLSHVASIEQQLREHTSQPHHHGVAAAVDPQQHARRSLRPKHGTQRNAGRSVAPAEQRRNVTLHEPQAAAQAEQLRVATSTPNDATNSRPMFNHVMLTINDDASTTAAAAAAANSGDQSSAGRKLQLLHGSHIRKGHYLRSPQVRQDAAAKARRNTSVVPVNLYRKDATVNRATLPGKIQFPKTHFDDQPKLLYTKASDVDISESNGKTSETRAQNLRSKAKPPKVIFNGHGSGQNECIMDISISKTRQGSNERVQISRQVSDPIPQLRVRNVVAPSNTPVISRQSSQDWLDQSFDQFDCSYD